MRYQFQIAIFVFQNLNIHKIKMNNLILLCVIFAASSVCAIPVPQDLTIAEFRSLRDEKTPTRQVFMSPSYAQVNLRLTKNLSSYYDRIIIISHIRQPIETH